jgi:thiamine-phosphate pyrophosphorylase
MNPPAPRPPHDALQRARLYGIVDLGYVAMGQAEQALRRMLAGGIEVVQLRAKSLPASEIAALARDLAPLPAQ